MMNAEARLNNLLSEPPRYIMNFGKALATSDTWLRGVGSILETGFPIPHRGYVYKIVVFDETTVHVQTELFKVELHDVIAFEADHDDVDSFTIKMYINGEDSGFHIDGIPESVNCALTVFFGLE